MGHLENIEITDSIDDVVKDIRESLGILEQDILEQDIEYRGLEGKITQMYNFAKMLDAQYQEVSKKNPDLAQLWFTRVIAEWSTFSVYDAEYHSSYALQLYGRYDPSKNELMNPWELPELINFDEYWARTTNVLDPEQYKEVCDKIVDILNREAEQISKMIQDRM